MAPLPLRIFRSFQAKYYEDDILCGPAAYPEEYFATLVEHGFNAVWLRGILRNLADTSVFPGMGEEIASHQDALALVVERARRHGVQVLLYLNEPLCFPSDHPFWQRYPEVRGASDNSLMDEWPETYAFCTSTPQVRAWLREVTTRLFSAVPDLGGWFLISASEHHTHCYSHAGPSHLPDCPRCAGRDPLEVVAELITDLRDGTRAASPDAHCIAWNWGWTDYFGAEPQHDLLARLPKDVTLLLDWERGGTRVMPNGKTNFVDEYSLSYVGPSERFRRTYDAARQHSLPVMVKLQVGTTHELATVPNLPLVDHLYQKIVGAEELGLHGILATWNFGNAFSLNTAAIGWLVRHPERPDPHTFVARLAEEYFALPDGEGVANAVAQFSAAMAYFPFDLSFVYFGPQNYALAYPLTLAPLTGKSMGWTWMMHERGDNLQEASNQFTVEEITDLLRQLVPAWQHGVTLLQAALAGSTHPHAAQELGVARIIGHCYRSAYNIYRTYLLRRDRPTDTEQQFTAILEDEIDNLAAALPLLEADPRLGFHAECQAYQYSAELVRAKLAGLCRILGTAGRNSST